MGGIKEREGLFCKDIKGCLSLSPRLLEILAQSGVDIRIAARSCCRRLSLHPLLVHTT